MLIVRNVCGNVGPTRTTRMRQYNRRDENPIVVAATNPEVDDILTKLEHNLERLTANIPETGFDDIQCAY